MSTDADVRIDPPSPVRLVLVHPEIPPNTGNVARTCAATGTPLHLVEPLGFELSDRYLKRAGLDYWPHVNLHCHGSWAQFHHQTKELGGRRIGFSTRGTINFWEFEFQAEDWLIFGKETAGLSPEIIQDCDTTVYIPMAQPQVRSLNLSVSAALGLFEARRQLCHGN
jgi:tRNA (cytidine/uridine-2'-O-)-methyltransferase